MVAVERIAKIEQQRASSLSEVLNAFNFADHPELPKMFCKLLLGNGTSLIFDIALRTEPSELVRVPVAIVSEEGRKKISEKKPGKIPRSAKEKSSIRRQYDSKKANLINRGPGLVLATIIENDGKAARWSAKGLEGRDSEWKTPSPENIAWWSIIYEISQEMIRGGKRIYELFEDEEKISLLYAFFRIRFQAARGQISEEVQTNFLNAISPFIDETGDLPRYFRKVTHQLSI